MTDKGEDDIPETWEVTMAVTIRDIAEKVGVAPSTVSRALNNKGRVSEGTRERILKVARELDYHPNMNAKGLATNKTGNIGLIIDKRHAPINFSFYGPVVEGLEAEASKHGYYLVLSTFASDGPPRCAKEKRVDGLILMGCELPAELILSLKDEIPLVLVDNHLDGVDSVAVDNVGGAYKAVKHLIKLGHRRIGFITERFRNLSFWERFEGYKLALKDHGLDYDEDLVAEGLRGDYGYEAMRKLLGGGRGSNSRPTAVFAANDAVAVGALRAIREAGLEVPGDIALVGFDDGSLALHADPPLTSVKVFRKRMGKIAIRRLLELIKGEEEGTTTTPLQIRLPTKLTIRESCGAL